MPEFDYHGLDTHGKPVSGRLDASSRDQALAALAARGIVIEPSQLNEVLEPERTGAGAKRPARRGERLSEQEAVDFADQVADLAGSGLPLPSGLRAMAEEMPSARVSRMLRDLAARLEAGTPLEKAIGADDSRLPAHIRGLILAGVRTRRLAEVMEQFVAVQRDRLEVRRRIAATMAYPICLCVLLLTLLLFVSVLVIPQFASFFVDFDVDLPAMTVLVLSLAGPGVWYLVHALVFLLLAIYLCFTLPRPTWLRKIAYRVPLIGPLTRSNGLVAFARIMSILLEHRVPLPEALRLTADGVHDPALAQACRGAARDVEAGMALSDSLALYWPFPVTLRPLVHWGQQVPNLAGAFQAAAEVFEGRVRVRDTYLASVVPPLTFLVIALGLGFIIISLFLPLINLISKLA